MNDLEMARRTIDEADRGMAELFVKRMRAAEVVAHYKKERGIPIYIPEREQEVLEKNAAMIEDPVICSHYMHFLRHVMNISKRYQRELIAGARIAYSGIAGAFAYIAASRIFPEAALVSFPGFPEAYRAVETGDCEHAVLPIENSYVGEVGQVTDMMFQGSLYINAVHTLRIRQNLLAVPGAHMSDIERVISHPQALAQCRDYIASHGFTAVEAGNTAVAAEQVARGADIHTAAIASQETAETYGLAVLDHDIQTSHENATRFAVFSRVQNKSPQEKEASRFMLMFTVRNEAGSLAKAIDIIGEYGFNMSSLRSRPLGSLAWQYYFFIEAHGDIFSAKGREMLGRLQNTCGMLKVVGNYPEPEEL